MAEPHRGIVLVVDDDADTRDLFFLVLAGAGLRCVPARSITEAMARASVVRFDAVVMDLGLPRIEHGLTLARWLRQTHDPPPLTVVTGHQLASGPDKDLFAAVLLKPIDPDDLVTTVLRVIRDSA